MGSLCRLNFDALTVSTLTRFLTRSLCTSSLMMDRGRVQSVALRSKKASKSSEDVRSSKGFRDWVRVKIAAGNGGDGSISLASIPFNEFAGPDGGNGGNGGHVIFRATKELSSLEDLSRTIVAMPGGKGGTEKCDGKNAPNKIVDVPVGTLFRNNETREVIAQLTTDEAMFLAAKGGAGGKGNTFFKSSESQTPRLAEAGGRGEIFVIDVELLTMAHFGLVGFPNAGKSTLLRAISRARPRVAAYPFTTMKPHIGIVSYDDDSSIAVADIPGLIEDSHKNRGLGINFLRHVERCLCLLYVIDMSNDDPMEQFQALRHELKMYKKDLPDKISAVIGNKMDLENSMENAKCFIHKFHEQFGGTVPVICVSGKQGSNISALLKFMKCVYDEYENK